MQMFDPEDFERPVSKVLSVTELTRSVRTVLEGAIGEVTVEGEIGSLRRQASGHQYFTLKDENCQVSCVLFRRPYQKSLKQVPLEDGMQVQVRGTVTVYEARGQYQIIVNSVQVAGAGLLQAKFEALKRRLAEEGLFRAERKRPLPRFPKVLGIVTSPTGAAIRDMLNILERRAPWIRIVIYPARVQGEGAAAEVVAGIQCLNGWATNGLPQPDVIVVTRGGGSMEDLWEFNHETLARAIHDSAIPVVSAVGHEIDFTISDFVADLRAPTPSAAAEMVAPDAAEILQRIAHMQNQMRRIVSGCMEHWRSRLGFVDRGGLYREPARILAQLAQRLDGLHETLERTANARIRDHRQQIDALVAVVRQHRPDQLLALRRQEINARVADLRQCVLDRVNRKKMRLEHAAGLLKVLSPTATLNRGYSVTLSEDGELIRSVSDAIPGMNLTTRLSDGFVKSRVLKES